MNRTEFFAMVKDVHEHPERLAYYRQKFKNVYPFSDGIFPKKSLRNCLTRTLPRMYL